jgi:archaemetzincin
LIRIKILSATELDQKVRQALKAGLARAFPASQITFLTQALRYPPACLDPYRKQYNSTLILRFLSKNVEKESDERILAVESADLFAGHLNFVFGEADINAGIAIVSTHRLNPEFYVDAPSQELFLIRLVKESVHELGHTFGLGHCPLPNCIMHFSNCISDTDFKGPDFCPRCKLALGLS